MTREERFERLTPKQLQRSYTAYQNQRQAASNKGYSMAREMTFDEYKRYRAALVKYKPDEKHPARYAAEMDKAFRYSEAKAIAARIQLEGDAYLRRKYKTAKDVYSLELTDKQREALEKQHARRVKKRGTPDKIPYQVSSRAKLFAQLLKHGFSYRDADRIMYGSNDE